MYIVNPRGAPRCIGRLNRENAETLRDEITGIVWNTGYLRSPFSIHSGASCRGGAFNLRLSTRPPGRIGAGAGETSAAAT